MVDGRFPEGVEREEESRRKLIEEAKQADLRQQAEQKIKEEVELKKQILEDYRPTLERMAAVRLIDSDPELQRSAAEMLAGELAQKKVNDPALMDGIDLSRAADRAVGEAIKTDELRREQETQEQARKAEELKQQEAEKQARELEEAETKKIAREEAARAEPIPGTMQRFKAILEASKAQREGQATAIEQPAELSNVRPLNARYDVSRSEQEPGTQMRGEQSEPRGEMSDAKAERLARMFNKPASDRALDPSHDPDNAMNFSNGRDSGRSR